MITRKLIKLAAVPAIGLIAGLGLAACGSQGHALLQRADHHEELPGDAGSRAIRD
jgi:hypothetical protein